ncbi:MAG: lactonase family protein [Actinomycetota bacterium]|nr:lactonase family protein [Actinomycetota bacterium]
MAKPSGASASLLLVRVEGLGLGALFARPIDPATLADIPGFTPLYLGHHYRSALSPDGRTLAAFVWPPSGGGSGTGGVLHLVDPLAWTDRVTDVQINQNLDWFGWSADGKQLYWLRSVDTDLQAIFAADIATLTVRELARLPAGFQPYETRVAGSRIAVLAAPNDGSLAKDDAAVVFIDSASGRISSQLHLSGMRLGQFAVSESGLYPYRMIVPGAAWDLARSRLVLVDAERDVVRIVDLLHETETGELAIHTRSSSKGPPGGAKLVSTTRKVATISPDGRWLYVSGLREDVLASDPGQVTLVPIAVQRVDLSTMGETARVAGGARLLLLSSDGSRLLSSGEESALLDATDLHELARVTGPPETGVTERQGVAYLTRWSYPGSATLRALDFRTGMILAARDVNQVADLIALR